MPAAEDNNALSCYPVYWAPNGGDAPELDWFHKYNVTAVTTTDPAGQNEPVENSYTYEPSPGLPRWLRRLRGTVPRWRARTRTAPLPRAADRRQDGPPLRRAFAVDGKCLCGAARLQHRLYGSDKAIRLFGSWFASIWRAWGGQGVAIGAALVRVGSPGARRMPIGAPRFVAARQRAMLGRLTALTLADLGVRTYDQLATAPHAPRLVPCMWQAARARGIDAPDWTGTTPPGDCALSPDRYHALLAERATGVRLDLQEDRVRAAAPPGSVIRLWNGATTTLHIGDGEETTLLLPPDGPYDTSAGNSGAAVFTRGDRPATGWLGAYTAIRL